MQGDNGDATEILQQDDTTSPRVDPADAPTEIDRGDAADTVVVTGSAASSREKTGLHARRIAAGGLSLGLIIMLVYTIAHRQPAPTDTAQPATDGYSEALAQAETAIRQGDVRSLPAVLLNHARTMPDNTDMQALLHDATLYRDMQFLLENGDLLQLAATRRRESFHTPLFEQYARLHIDPDLGAAAALQGLATAREAWRAGELVQAITAAKQVRSATPNTQAQAMLMHYSKVVDDYEALSGQTPDKAVAQKLLAFYAGLDPLQDRFFWRNLEKDFKQVEDPLAASNAQQLQRAGRLWSSYQGHAGINGAMRQAAGADSGFRQRAEELNEARRLVSEVTDTLYQPGQTEAEASLLLQLIDEEVGLQRDRLQMLLRFNNETVLNDRLLLLQPIDTAR